MTRSETEVFLACYRFLNERGWTVLGGEAPGGSAHIPRIEIHPPTGTTHGSTGSRKVDLIAHRDGIVLLLELKPTYDRADVLKLDALVRSPAWRSALVEAFDQRRIFERFDLSADLREGIVSGAALQPAIGVGAGAIPLPDDYAGLVVSGDDVRAWTEDHATLDSLR